MTEDETRIQKFTPIIMAYPFVLIFISIALNLFAFKISPAIISLPSEPVISALVIAAILLLLNHTWLMTSTELTRLNFNMHATPEEWDKSDINREEVTQKGWLELERRHNAHRNATENVVYFVFLALIMSVMTPTTLTAQIWIIGFALARLGYTFCYLNSMTSVRGLFMSLTLLGTYGLASYLAISLIM